MPPNIPSNDAVPCPYCQKEVRPRGLGAHKRHCTKKPLDEGQLAEKLLTDALLQRERAAERAAFQKATGATPANANNEIGAQDNAFDFTDDLTEDNMIVDDDRANNSDVSSDSDDPEDDPDVSMGSINKPLSDGTNKLNDIMVIKHPRSGEDPCVYSFEDYYDPLDNDTPPSDITTVNDRLPWRPFRSRIDFELAELMQGAMLSKEEIETLLKLVHRIASEPREFTIGNFNDLSQAWTMAREANDSNGFKIQTFLLPYKDEQLSYDVWVRPLWNWCRELLLDKELIKEFTWDAQQLFKFNGEEFVRFIDEPWTADAWWEFQSRPTTLPGAHAFFFILWADKTKLSSFGTVKGYPVLVRCANLPIDIRNGTGQGGGRLIGWLPVTQDKASDNRRQKYVDLKKVVWHTAMRIILESIAPYTHTGCTLVCGDNVTRTIMPHALMLSADYEEQVMMSLTRGAKAIKGCPNCYVPTAEMSNIAKEYPRRTTEESKEAFQHGQQLRTAELREEHYKELGLQGVENAFWTLNGFDVHHALSFDVLHAYDAGLFKTHILEELKEIVDKMGLQTQAAVETALEKMPPWPGLNRFKTLQTGEMADGAKFEDLSKVILFAALPVLTPTASPRGYALLCLLRDYLELRMYAGLTVHTETTIAQGQVNLRRFGKSLKKYQKVTATLPKPKSWNFPKCHTHTHMFQDILEKGATRNYNTKPNEKANGPLKTIYQQRTNFKDISPQILKINEMDLIATTIRTAIELYDEHVEDSESESQTAASITLTDGPGDDSGSQSQGSQDKANSSSISNDHFHLGSALTPRTAIEIENEYSTKDALFTNFRKKIGHYFSGLFGKRITLHPEQEITPYQFIKVYYRSLVDLNVEQNILRTNEKFYNKERFDCALIQVDSKRSQAVFVKLRFLFGIQMDEKMYYLALALPMDQLCTPNRNTNRDKDLRIKRVRPRVPESSVIIHVGTILRGGHLPRDGGSRVSEEYIINDFIDQDMWMRMQPEYTTLVTRAVF